MRRFTLLLLGAALIAGLGFVIDAQSRVRVDRPAGPLGPRLIYAPGRVEGATPEIELRPRLSGLIKEALVREGQFVEQGAVLLCQDDEQHRYEVELAAADLALANAELERLVNGARPEEIAEAAALWRAKSAELESARLSLDRFEELLKTNAISRQTADDQRALVAAFTGQAEAAKARLDRLEAPAREEDVRIAQARAQAAAARLALAKVQLDRTVLRAPIRGQILEVDVEAGELAGPDSPRPAVILADTTRFRVRAFVEEIDAPRVQIGMACKVTVDGLPDRRLNGRVAEITPRMSHKELWSDRPGERLDTKTREAWIDLEPASDLVVGLRVDVTIDPQVAGLGAEALPPSEEIESNETPHPVLEPLAHAASEQR